MLDEEESMELSAGEYSFGAPDLSKLNIDISWSTGDIKTFHASTPHQHSSRLVPRRTWKSLHIKPKQGPQEWLGISDDITALVPITQSSRSSVSIHDQQQFSKAHSSQSDMSISYSEAVPDHRPSSDEIPKGREMKERCISPGKRGLEPERKRRRFEKKQEGNHKMPFLACLMVAVVSISIATVYTLMIDDTCPHLSINIKNLEQNLWENVFGQHVAVRKIVSVLEDFSRESSQRNGSRILCMSFHGWTGVGKNYVSSFVTSAFPSARIAWFLIPLEFPHEDSDEEYQDEIQSWIEGNVTSCGTSIFVFDEMDKARPAILKGIQGAIEDLKDEHETTGILKKAQIVFLFLSNSKSAHINKYLFSETSQGRPRKSLQINEFLSMFKDSSEAEWYHGMYQANLLSTFIPFLPLEEDHVRKCVVREFIKRGTNPSDELVTQVLEELSFFELDNYGSYSRTGCKRVQDKVDLFMDD